MWPCRREGKLIEENIGWNPNDKGGEKGSPYEWDDQGLEEALDGCNEDKAASNPTAPE